MQVDQKQDGGCSLMLPAKAIISHSIKEAYAGHKVKFPIFFYSWYIYIANLSVFLLALLVLGKDGRIWRILQNSFQVIFFLSTYILVNLVRFEYSRQFSQESCDLLGQEVKITGR